MDAIPTSIHEGMSVVDSDLQPIGTVETFRSSDVVPDHPEQNAAGVSPALDQPQGDLTRLLADVFSPGDGLPREMQEKALREGFVRLESEGLLAADRYIFPEHIDRLEGDRLVLNVGKAQLLKA